MVAWPAVLKYSRSDALVVVDNQDEWDIDPELNAWPYDEDDRLIDSDGIEYRPAFGGSAPAGKAGLEPTGTAWTSSLFAPLAEKHLTLAGVPTEWLTAHLAEIPEPQKVRAAIQYVVRY